MKSFLVIGMGRFGTAVAQELTELGQEVLAIDENVESVQRIAEDYDIFFYPREVLPPLTIGNYTYTAIPKCYALLDTTALVASGITRLQNQPVLALKGEGVLVGIIDTGVDYTNPLFRYSDGSSRILRIWDQTVQDGTPPEGILYGAEYR